MESLRERLTDWLSSDEIFFQIHSADFKKINASPRHLIPTYSAAEVPNALRQRGLEHFRNLNGGCVLIRRRDFNLPTLFPSLKCTTKEEKKTLTIPATLDILRNVSLHNEETGIVLMKEFHLINDFLDTPEEFKLGGRIKTKVSGLATIGGRTFEVKATQVEVDNFLESESRIITIEAKLMRTQPRESFSLHQFALPTLLLCQRTQKPISSILLEYQPDSLRFRTFHFKIAYEKGIVHLDRYSLINCKKYVIELT